MKKLSFILITSVVLAAMTACIRARIEKDAVIIENKNTSDVSLDNLEKQEDNSSSQAKVEEGQNTQFNPTSSDDKPTVPTEQENNNTGEEEDISNDNGENPEADLIPASIIIEGMEEIINYKQYKSDLGFSIMYDSDRFSVSNTADGVLQIIAPNPDPGIYPYVYINISRYDYSDVASFSKLEQDLQDNKIRNLNISGDTEKYYWFKVPESPDNHPHYVQLTSSDSKSLDIIREESISGKKAYAYIIRQGNSWNSAVRKYYFITLDSYVYKIEVQYFVEAEEGYGVRLNSMLSTLLFD